MRERLEERSPFVEVLSCSCVEKEDSRKNSCRTFPCMTHEQTKSVFKSSSLLHHLQGMFSAAKEQEKWDAFTEKSHVKAFKRQAISQTFHIRL